MMIFRGAMMPDGYESDSTRQAKAESKQLIKMKIVEEQKYDSKMSSQRPTEKAVERPRSRVLLDKQEL